MGLMKKKKKGALGEITMASTRDVAFLLLIFFIVTTIFAAEQGLTLVLPGKQKNQEDIQKYSEKNIATSARVLGLRISAIPQIRMIRRIMPLMLI